MNNPWTPGPWIMVPLDKPDVGIMGDGWWIASAHTGIPTVQKNANARLIAASPEMAEALEAAERKMVLWFRLGSPSGNIGEENAFADDDPTVKHIRALLARIRGTDGDGV